MSIGKGTAMLTVSSVVFMLSGYLINIILGKVLGPALYGSYGLIIAALSLVNIVQTAGLPQALAKIISNRDTSDRALIFGSAIKLQLFTTLLLTLTFIVLVEPLALLLGDKELAPLLYASSLVFPIYSVYAIYAGYYNGTRDFKRQAFINIIYSLSKFILVIVLAINFGILGAVAGFIISPAVTLLINVKSLPALRSKYPWKEMFLLSMPLIGFALFSTSLLSIDIFLLKAFESNNAIVGYYAAAQNIARIPYYALNAVAIVLFPSIAKLIYEKKFNEIKVTIKKALRVVSIILIFISAVMFVSAEHLLKFLFTSEYVPGSTALQILLIGYGLLLLFTIFATILSSYKYASLSLKLSIASLLVTVVSCMILIPHLGIFGAAIGTLLGGLFSACASYYLIRRIFKVSLPYLTILRSSLCTGIALTPVFFINGSLFEMSAGWLLSCVFYVVLLYFLKEVSPSELNLLLKYFKRKKV